MPPKLPKAPKLPSQRMRGIKGKVADEIVAKVQTAHHTGKVELNLTGKGKITEFDPEIAAQLIRAQDYAVNRAKEAQAAEELARIARERVEAARLEFETAQATASDSEVRLAQDRFQTLDRHAREAEKVAALRRMEAEEAEARLAAIEDSPEVADRQKKIDQAIRETEERVAFLEREQRADQILTRLTEETANYQKAMRERAQASSDLKAAKQRLAEASLAAKRSGANPEKSAIDIEAANGAVEQALAARENAKRSCEAKGTNKNHWKKVAEDFLADPGSEILDPLQLNAIRQAIDAAEHAAEAVVLNKASQKIANTVSRLREAAAEFDKAGFELESARQAKLKADRALTEAERTAGDVDAARKEAVQAEQVFVEAKKNYNRKRKAQTYIKAEAEKLLPETEGEQRGILESAIGQANPTVSLPERMLEAISERDAAYANLAQAQQNWRDAVKNIKASADPGVEEAAQTLQVAKDEFDYSSKRVISVGKAIQKALDDPRLPQPDREVLNSALASARAAEAQRETVYILDGLAESHIKNDANIQAKEEAFKALEAAKASLEEAQRVGGDLNAVTQKFQEAEKVYDDARSRWDAERSAVGYWEKRYERILPHDDLISLQLNEEAVQVIAKLEGALAERAALVSMRDQAKAAKKLADTRVNQLKSAGDKAGLPAAQAEAQAAAKKLEEAIDGLNHISPAIEGWKTKAEALLTHPEDWALADFNRTRLENALVKVAARERNANDLADCLKAAVVARAADYEALPKAQIQVQQAREQLALARQSGQEDVIRDAEANYANVSLAFKEIETRIKRNSANVSQWEIQADQFLQRSTLSEEDRRIIQEALNQAARSKMEYEPAYVRGQLSEKKAQLQEALELRDKARAAWEEAQVNYAKAAEAGQGIEEAKARLEAVKEDLGNAERVVHGKTTIYSSWKARFAIMSGGGTAVTATFIMDEAMAADPIREQKERARQEVELKAAQAEVVTGARVLVQYTGTQLRRAKESWEQAQAAAALPGAGPIQYADLAQALEIMQKAQCTHQAAKDYYFEVRLHPKREAILTEKLAQHPELAYWLKHYPTVQAQDEAKLQELWEMISQNQAPGNEEVAEGTVGQVSLDGTGIVGLVQLAQLRPQLAAVVRRHTTPDPILNPRLAPCLNEIAAENVKAQMQLRDEDELAELATGRWPNLITIPDQLEVVSAKDKPKQLSSAQAADKAWAKLYEAEMVPTSQNLTPNVWESPEVNMSEAGGEYEVAMRVEESFESRASAQITLPGPKVF